MDECKVKAMGARAIFLGLPTCGPIFHVPDINLGMVDLVGQPRWKVDSLQKKLEEVKRKVGEAAKEYEKCPESKDCFAECCAVRSSCCSCAYKLHQNCPFLTIELLDFIFVKV